MDIGSLFIRGISKVALPIVENVEKRKILDDAYAYFRGKYMDPTFPWKQYMGIQNEYFAKWGLSVSNMECEYFAQCSGVKSDVYIPYYVWKYYIYPYLNKDSWRYPYSDKNMIQRILRLDRLSSVLDISLPESVVSNIGGQYYRNGVEPSNLRECVDALVKETEELIVKPSVESSGGKGIQCVCFGGMKAESIMEILHQYGEDFDIQRKLRQHPTLAHFNETSINTIRMTTYRDMDGNIKLLYAIQRFGKSGTVLDNASSGGGYCGISRQGVYQNRIHRHRSVKTESLQLECERVVPFFDRCVNAVCVLHQQLPQFRIVGWDVSIDPEGHLHLLEYNFVPGYNLPQTSVGPFFSKEELDEIMKQASKGRFSVSFQGRFSQPGRPGYYYNTK